MIERALNPHRNYLWADYVQTLNERCQTLDSYLQQNLKIVHTLHKRGEKLSKGIDERLKMLASKLTTSKKLLNEIAEEPTWEQVRQSASSKSIRDLDFLAQKVERYKYFNLLSNQVPIGHANLLIPLTLACLEQPDSSGFIIGSLKLSNSFYTAASVLLNETFQILYPKDQATSNHMRPEVICWPQHDYSFLGSSKLIAVPPCDAERCCFWTNIIHEALHEKTQEINVWVEPESLIESQEETEPQLTGTDDNEASLVTQWNRSRFRIAAQLKEETLGSHIEWSWRRTDGTDRYLPPLAYYVSQVDEVFCDIATAKICGLPDLFTKGVLWAPSFRNFIYSVDRYLEDTTHPPDVVRLRYIIQSLKGSDMGYSQSDLAFLEDQLEGLKRFDLAASTYSLYPSILDIYERALRPYIPAISDFVSKLFAKQHFLTAEKWRTIKDEYGSSKRISGILDSMNPSERARCLVGISWLKRMEIHEQAMVGTYGYDVERFHQIHKDERRFFADLVEFMARL